MVQKQAEDITDINVLANKISEIAVFYYMTHGLPKSILREDVEKRFGVLITEMVFWGTKSG